jgi:hypothetical protein
LSVADVAQGSHFSPAALRSLEVKDERYTAAVGSFLIMDWVAPTVIPSAARNLLVMFFPAKADPSLRDDTGWEPFCQPAKQTFSS